MAKADIPVLEGDGGESQDDASLAEAAARTGYPLMVKPTAGGGGKGMRIVESSAGLAGALAAARREATAAFGDGRVLLERYVERARHIEVQIFADGRGNVVHLFERDCSLQRRHQKVVEEAPAPGLDEAFRRRLAETAMRAARAADYVGAGTVEFLVDGEGGFYFLEMNTRLQVEHPVTEMITGQDLVEWQLRVAAGEPLPCDQRSLTLSGHAIEARLYAEDPARGFLPAAGRIAHLRLPDECPDLRIDTGVRAGDSVSPYYDPLIAKVIVRAADRAAALDRLRSALAALQIVGPSTNRTFLIALVGHPMMDAGAVDSGFIERERGALVPPPRPASARVLALACLDALMHSAEVAAARSHDPHSPWLTSRAWRLNVEARHCQHFRDGEIEHAVSVHFGRENYRLEFPGGAILARGRRDEAGDLVAEIDGEACRATVVTHGRNVTVLVDGEACDLVRHDPLDAVEDDVAGGRLTAPMPGKVVAVMARPGDEVARGAPLMVLEAMKMEHTISAPLRGRVERVNYAAGDLVDEGAELIAFESAGET